MAKYLYLLLLLLLPSQSSAQYNACYCTSNWRQDSTFGQACTANSDCWACAPGAYSTAWQQAFCSGYTAPAPVVNIETQFLSCPPNHSGSITQTRTITNGTAGPWTTTSNTCVRNPPTCQTSTQTQTLSCPTGYTGSITQSQTSTCPDPYGSPIWPGAWTTNSNTCVKSVTNPTNPTSPVSPLNPASVVSSPAAAVTSTATVSATSVAPTALTPDTTPAGSGADAPPTSSGGSTAPAPASSATSTPAPTTSAKTGAATRAQQIANTVRMVTTLDIIERNSIKQFDAFPIIPFGLNMPEDIIKYQAIGLELIQTGMPNIVQDVQKLKENSLEIEQ